MPLARTEIEVIGSWLKATEPLLFDGDITAVVARIRGFAAQQSEVLDILEREARYFEKHAERMPYKVFREKEYHIRSGVIESACKQVVG